MVTKANVIICVVAILVVAALQLFMNFTKIGKAMRCVAQNKKAAALMGINVAQNICVVPNLLKYSKEACDKIVHELLELVNLPYEQYAHKYPSEMSGGQQQRLCIARAMAVSPSVLLMDEPASALDPISTAKVEELIHELKKDYTIVIVTHNMQQAARVSDKTAFFYMGEMVEFDNTKKIFTNPEKEATQNYITGRFG